MGDIMGICWGISGGMSWGILLGIQRIMGDVMGNIMGNIIGDIRSFFLEKQKRPREASPAPDPPAFKKVPFFLKTQNVPARPCSAPEPPAYIHISLTQGFKIIQVHDSKQVPGGPSEGGNATPGRTALKKVSVF